MILVGIGVIIGLAICRKRTNAPVLEGPDDFITPTYVPAQRIEPRIRYSGESRGRSQRASLYVEENRNGKLRQEIALTIPPPLARQLPVGIALKPSITVSEPDLLHRVELDLQD